MFFLDDTIWKTALHSTVEENRLIILNAVQKIIDIHMNHTESYLKRLCNNWTPRTFFQSSSKTLNIDPAALERAVYSVGGALFGCVSTLGGMGHMNWSKERAF